MDNTSMTIKVPGKLMIAGEFAVLEPYQKLAVTAVDRFVYASIEQSERNTLTLHDFDLEELEWSYEAEEVKIHSDDKRTQFVCDAMTVVYTYLKENNVRLGKFHLAIRSELDDSSGIKYGLGSSAAVVTSVITAILNKFHVEKPASELVFRLAAISHVKTQGNGSGADVAASSFGGMLQYASFQAEWLLDAYKNRNSITDLVESTWTYYDAKSIQMPKNVYFCVGWTGKPASTSKLVDRILQLKSDNPEAFQRFLNASKLAVDQFLQGMENADVELLLKGVKQNREALATVGKDADTPVETPLLGTLCDLAESLGGAGKPSGAGGGDCGIAFMPSKQQADELMKAWEEAGIKALSLQSYQYGANIIIE
ncbi:phosphomevalonate kinase [Paenibacillus sp. 7884-2]|nr:phosphomevalonate kinase [Paenibacillus sp. 7884-2]